MKSCDEQFRPYDGDVEFELLLRSAAPILTSTAARHMAKWPGATLDWQRVIALAEWHRTIPLLFGRLRSLCAPAVPPAVLDRLRRHTLAHASHSTRLTQMLFLVLDMLRQQGIPALAYKGPILASLAYEQAEDRLFDDIDFLVPPAKLDDACCHLLKGGFSLYPEARPGRLRSHPGHGRTLRGAARDVWVDLDSGIAEDEARGPLGWTRLFQGRQVVHLEGKPVATVAKDDLLLILCVHGARHEWRRLVWIADVAGLLVRNPPLDWPRIVTTAREAGLLQRLRLGLGLANLLFAVPIPPLIAEPDGWDATTCRMLGEIVKRLRGLGRDDDNPLAMIRFHWRLRERHRDRCRYLARRILAPTHADWRALPLPPSLRFLYYALRPLRLGLRCVCAAFEQLARLTTINISNAPHRPRGT